MREQIAVDFQEAVDAGKDLPFAVVNVLTQVLKRSQASTAMELEEELRGIALPAATALAKESATDSNNCLAAVAVGDLFLRYLPRNGVYEMLDVEFSRVKELLLERAMQYTAKMESSRKSMAENASSFIGNNGCVVLVHGFSQGVLDILALAASCNKVFRAVVTESRMDGSGARMVTALAEHKIPSHLIPDAAVAHMMSKVDMVLCGAEGVMENGAIVNKIGTFQLAIVARAFHKPFYVAAESYKFTRNFPLGQTDIPHIRSAPLPGTTTTRETPEADTTEDNMMIGSLPATTECSSSLSDLTPPDYITLMFTDIGVLTPAGVSDELIKLHF